MPSSPNKDPKSAWTKNDTLKEISSHQNVTSITIPDNVTEIDEAAFEGCTGLTSIILPPWVTKIGDGAFNNCTGLTSITLPNTITSIGDAAFADCTSLTSITLPNTITSIGDAAFADCTSLISITLPASVERIGDMAFADCIGLTSITIRHSNKSIGKMAFKNCSGLTSIGLSGITKLDDNAFWNCTGLTSITITGSLTEISKDAFDDTNLKLIVITDDFPKGLIESVGNIGSALIISENNHDKLNIKLAEINLPQLHSKTLSFETKVFLFKLISLQDFTLAKKPLNQVFPDEKIHALLVEIFSLITKHTPSDLLPIIGKYLSLANIACCVRTSINKGHFI